MKELPTRLVKFFGHSDDCFEIEGAVSAEVNDGVFCIEDPAGQRINLVATYGQFHTGMWLLGLQAIEDGIPWPTWHMDWHMHENEYSPVLSMSLPVGSTITRIYPEPGSCDSCRRPTDPERWTVPQ